MHPDADPNAPDAPPPIDAAPLPDAPPGISQVNLVQDTDPTILAGAVACTNNQEGGTTPNTYYRVFDLNAVGVTNDLTVQTVQFSVEDCESVSGNGTAVAVRIGTYSGTVGSTLDPSKITIIDSNNSVQIPEVDENPNTATGSPTPGEVITAPVSTVVPKGSLMVVEVDATIDGSGTYQLYMGTNLSAQTGTSYISAPGCSPPGTTPTDFDQVAPQTPTPSPSHLLLSVTGQFQP